MKTMPTLFESIPMSTILPQQPPFVMVDKLLLFDETTTVTRFEVRQDNLFVDNGVLNACAIVENIAQTCAARLGYYNVYILKCGIKLGFIGAIRDLQVMREPVVGDTLETTITVLEDIMGLTLADAVVRCHDEVIATAQMKIATPEVAPQTT